MNLVVHRHQRACYVIQAFSHIAEYLNLVALQGRAFMWNMDFHACVLNKTLAIQSAVL